MQLTWYLFCHPSIQESITCLSPCILDSRSDSPSGRPLEKVEIWTLNLFFFNFKAWFTCSFKSETYLGVLEMVIRGVYVLICDL